MTVIRGKHQCLENKATNAHKTDSYKRTKELNFLDKFYTNKHYTFRRRLTCPDNDNGNIGLAPVIEPDMGLSSKCIIAS